MSEGSSIVKLEWHQVALNYGSNKPKLGRTDFQSLNVLLNTMKELRASTTESSSNSIYCHFVQVLVQAMWTCDSRIY